MRVGTGEGDWGDVVASVGSVGTVSGSHMWMGPSSISSCTVVGAGGTGGGSMGIGSGGALPRRRKRRF